ncbi:MAG: tyrosine--tRNA ligase [Kiritimatiellaeota bacterium]|nr:tyrosine--tRNA ligase [Kiritimatiellota bacterium]
MNVIDTLKERGLFDNWTSPDLYNLLGSPVTLYGGFDPSASSLQAGNFVAIMTLCHYQRAGHDVIALVGGATGLIGDPSGKTAERQMLTEDAVAENIVGIKENLSRFLDFGEGKGKARLVNNYDWHREFTFVSFLRDVGRHFRMGAMLGKESVRQRLASDNGMSFTEFCYQTLQGYDFLHLHEKYGCRLQIGGSDQWGNITAGTDLIRRLNGAEAYGMTLPLITDSQGRKFGKSEGNAMYLDSRKTSCYSFYQFFLRSEDADVARYLKAFTFIPLDEIAALEEQVRVAPEKREAQRALAEDVVRRVHGEDGLRKAKQATDALFGGSLAGMTADDLLPLFADAPSAELPSSEIIGATAAKIAMDSGLCKSLGEARRLADGGGFYINNEKTSATAIVTASQLIDGKLLILRSGKKTYRVVKAV